MRCQFHGQFTVHFIKILPYVRSKVTYIILQPEWEFDNSVDLATMFSELLQLLLGTPVIGTAVSTLYYKRSKVARLEYTGHELEQNSR